MQHLVEIMQLTELLLACFANCGLVLLGRERERGGQGWIYPEETTKKEKRKHSVTSGMLLRLNV